MIDFGKHLSRASGEKLVDPNEIYERYYRRIKELHERHGIPFRYADVTAWSAERRPAP